MPVLYEDEAIVAINKPGGLLTLPDRFDRTAPNLRQLLTDRYGGIFVVHRLDRGTSGVIVFAKTAAAHRELSRQFGARQVEKRYHALVRGRPTWTERAITLRLAPDPKRKGLMQTHRLGKPARTECRVIETFRECTLVECVPQTGRQHQIRVHLSAVGYPLLVDPDYGSAADFFLSSVKRGYKTSAGEERPLIARLTLHAVQLTIAHPVTAQSLTIEAAFPKDLRATLQVVRKYGRT